MNGTPFVEISTHPSANAAMIFGYISDSTGGFGNPDTDIFVTEADQITAGYFLSTNIFESPNTVTIISDSFMNPSVVDLADAMFNGDPFTTSTLFKVDEAGNQSRYAYVGWFYGFKVHIVINDQGELLAFAITSGNVDDRKPVPKLTKHLIGNISQHIFSQFHHL